MKIEIETDVIMRMSSIADEDRKMSQGIDVMGPSRAVTHADKLACGIPVDSGPYYNLLA